MGLAAKYASLYNAKGALRDRGKKPMQSSGDVGYGGQNQMSGMYGTNTYQGGNSLASMMGGQGQNSEEGREKERVLFYETTCRPIFPRYRFRENPSRIKPCWSHSRE